MLECNASRNHTLLRKPISQASLSLVAFVLALARAHTPRTGDYIHSIRLLLFSAYHFPCFNFPLVCFSLWEFCHCYFSSHSFVPSFRIPSSLTLAFNFFVPSCRSSCDCDVTFVVRSLFTWVASTFSEWIKKSKLSIAFGHALIEHLIQTEFLFFLILSPSRSLFTFRNYAK